MKTKYVIIILTTFLTNWASAMTAAPTSTCDYTLTLNDSWGDGWNGASIDVEENSSNIGNYSITSTTSSTETFTITLTDAASIELLFNSGTYDNECSYTLTDPFGNVVCSGGLGLSAGSLCIFTANCTGPDTPCKAEYLNPQASVCGSISYATYNNNNSTDSGETDPGCGSYGGADVWFSAVVPSSGGFDILTQANGLNDMAMAVYTGSCSSLTLENCVANGSGNMPTHTLSAMTPGDSIFIRVWDEGGNETGTFDIVLDDPNPDYCLVGDATPTGTDDCIQLTENTTSQQGCAWSGTPFDFTSDFDTEFTVNLGSSDGGADGVCFVIQNSAAGPSSACGASGGGLGAQGITPSVLIEFDTWANGNRTVGHDDVTWEPACDHIAVETDGQPIVDGSTNYAPAFGPVQASSTSCDIEDGANHLVRITYDAGTNEITIYFDGVQRLQFNFDLASHFGSTSAYWGFTASTGGLSNEQTFCPGTLPGFGLSSKLTDVFLECSGSNSVIEWKNMEEENVNYYVIESSDDNETFSPLFTLSAQSSLESSYTYLDKNQSMYYRIKTVEFTGAISYSKVLKSLCSDRSLNLNISSNEKHIDVFYRTKHKQNLSINIFDITGKQVYADQFISNRGENQHSINLEHLSSSIYIVNVVGESLSDSKKFVLE